MAATSIQWTDWSINPIRFGKGHYCQKISPGCAACYAGRMQRRFGNSDYPGQGSTPPQTHWKGGLWFDQSKLSDVLRRRRPTRIFWCDMTDLFGSWVPDEWIDRCFATMALTPQHTHQVLTKRPELMLAYSKWGALFHEWPLPNVWLGVSVEDQQRTDERIPLLLQTPAAVRFLSCEPLLGPIDLSDFCENSKRRPALWVIVGGESGRNARPCHVDWIRSIVRQCKEAEIACFVKQLGSEPRPSALPSDVCVRTIMDRKGGAPSEWPEDLRVREYPCE